MISTRRCDRWLCRDGRAFRSRDCRLLRECAKPWIVSGPRPSRHSAMHGKVAVFRRLESSSGIFRPSELEDEVCLPTTDLLWRRQHTQVSQAPPGRPKVCQCALTVESGKGRVATEGSRAGTRLELSLSGPSEQSPERGYRTKRCARVREGVTRLNWESFEETRVQVPRPRLLGYASPGGRTSREQGGIKRHLVQLKRH